ncbi:unnamed protein product [Symbiodinium microadriaticum]|nr:unnamed protein product [Symbiodinium microadriaticum]
MLALLNTSLRYLCAASSGLMEQELIELLNVTYYVSLDDTVASVGARIDTGVARHMTYEDWSNVYVLIKLFLKTSIPTFVDDSRPFKPRFMLRSDTIRRVVESHILVNAVTSLENALMPQRRQLVDYFERCSDELRVVEEYPLQLLAIGDYLKLKVFMRSPTFSKVRFRQRLVIVDKMRCMTVVSIGQGGPGPNSPRNEMMCINCSMKCTFNPKRFNKSSCYVCGGEIFSQSIIIGGQARFQQSANESLVYMCRLHNIRAYQAGPANVHMFCLLCKLPLPSFHSIPVVMCRMCAMNKSRCCELRST